MARYVGTYGTERVKKTVFAAAVPPYLYKTAGNPDGGLDDATILHFQNGVRSDRIALIDVFTKNFFAAGSKTDLVSEAFRRYNNDIANAASPKAILDCIGAFSFTDFREDLKSFAGVPTLILHGDADAIVPFEVSGKRTHAAIPGSQLVVIKDGPHGINATHATEFNAALLQFLKG